MEASACPGESGIGRGCAGFSSKPRTRPSPSIAITPKPFASSRLTCTQPTVMSARCSRWNRSIGP